MRSVSPTMRLILRATALMITGGWPRRSSTFNSAGELRAVIVAPGFLLLLDLGVEIVLPQLGHGQVVICVFLLGRRGVILILILFVIEQRSESCR
jgi:hypothetical protein